MAEEKRKKEEFREFQRKIKESIKDQMVKKQSKEGLLDESTTQLNNGGGDDKDGEAPIAAEE